MGVLTEDGRAFKANKAVVMACGGFEYNQTMMNMANTVGFSGIRGTGGWFNRGDGVKMVQALGAELWNMNNFSGNRIAIKIVDPKLKKSKVEVGACTGCHDSTALELPGGGRPCGLPRQQSRPPRPSRRGGTFVHNVCELPQTP